MQTVAVIDYGSGNLRSVERALERAAADANRRREVRITADPDFIARADRIVLPGVGAFAACRRGLAALSGVEEALTERVARGGAPFLGVCVGMQLLADRGHEDADSHGDLPEAEATPGFGWIGGAVKRVTPADPALAVPHMGWNALRIGTAHPVLDGVGTGDFVYFVHSYAVTGAPEGVIVATTDYAGEITAAVAKDNLFAAQFHPEKSQRAGLRLLANWLDWRP